VNNFVCVGIIVVVRFQSTLQQPEAGALDIFVGQTFVD